MTGKYDEHAFSPGDVMRRLAEIERLFQDTQHARRLAAATIGTGGLRVQGGRLTIQDTAGDDMFRAGGDPGELFLRQDLLTPLALAIFADRIEVDIASGQVEALDLDGYQDLGGPEIDVDIGPSGTALVFISSAMNGANSSAAAGEFAGTGARMSFEVTGATDEAPSNNRSIAFSHQVAVGGQNTTISVSERYGTSVVVPGLNEGTHTFRVLYARLFPGDTALFTDRTIVVIGF